MSNLCLGAVVAFVVPDLDWAGPGLGGGYGGPDQTPKSQNLRMGPDPQIIQLRLLTHCLAYLVWVLGGLVPPTGRLPLDPF